MLVFEQSKKNPGNKRPTGYDLEDSTGSFTFKVFVDTYKFALDVPL